MRIKIIKYYQNVIIIFTIIVLLISCQEFNENSKKYKIKLRKVVEKELIEFDTIVSLDYLTKKNKNNEGFDLNNFEYFIAFNYPKLKCSNINKNKLILSNDTIKIELKTIPFNLKEVEKKLKVDKDYYLKHSFFGIDEIDLNNIKWKRKPYNKLSAINIQINNITTKLPQQEFENFFDVNIIIDSDYCPTNAYLTENDEIIIIMENGGGSTFYYAIFVLNNEGELIEKLIKSVI